MLFICNEGNLKTKAEKRNGVTWVMGYHFESPTNFYFL